MPLNKEQESNLVLITLFQLYENLISRLHLVDSLADYEDVAKNQSTSQEASERFDIPDLEPVMDPKRFTDYLVARVKYVTKIKDISIDNKAFSLHYRVTCTAILVFSVVVTVNQFFGIGGGPIACIKNTLTDGAAKNEQKVMDNYCWIEGTFILPLKLVDSIEREARGEVEIPHVGISILNDRYIPDEIVVTKYYQWVPVVLFFQCLAFYLTRLVWKRMEGGLQKKIVDKLFKSLYKKSDLIKHQKSLVEYLYRERGEHNKYALKYFICIVINAAHVIVELAFINWFIGGRYWTYGLDEWNGVQPSPMRRNFPTVTKCRFYKFGPSGDIQKHDNLCILAINILNEKGYLLLWWWLWILFAISALAVIYDLVVMAFPSSRFYLLANFNRLVPGDAFEIVLDRISYGDWFLLYLLSKNLDPFHYRDVIVQLAQRLEEERHGGGTKQANNAKMLLDDPSSESANSEEHEEQVETSI